jgi:hypothetical protein
VDDGADSGVGVGHQGRQAVLHDGIRARPAGAPGIQRIDRQQARIEQFFQAIDSGGRQRGQRDLHVMRHVDQELALAAGVVDADQPAGGDRVRLGEHHQGGGQLVHVLDTLDAIAVESGLVGVVTAGYCARVRNHQPGRELGAPDLQNDHRDALAIGLGKRGGQASGAARGLHEEADDPCFGSVERPVHVLIHGHA